MLHAEAFQSTRDFGDEAGVCADLMRFLVRMRGALTPPPRMDAPVTKMPLEREHAIRENRTRDARRVGGRSRTILPRGRLILCRDRYQSTPTGTDLTLRGICRR